MGTGATPQAGQGHWSDAPDGSGALERRPRRARGTGATPQMGQGHWSDEDGTGGSGAAEQTQDNPYMNRGRCL